MKDNLNIIFKNLPQSDVPADLFLNIMNSVKIIKSRTIIKWGMVVISLSFALSLWYLYSSMIELDSITVFKYALQTIEFDKHSIFESVTFAASFIPLFAFIFFVINSFALAMILRLNKIKFSFYSSKFAI